MAWGLDGIQLSNKVQAVKIEESTDLIGFINDIGKMMGWDLNQVYTNAIQNLKNPKYYDFYLTRDGWKVETDKGEKAEDYQRDYQGLTFNKEIIATLLTDQSNNTNVKLNGVKLNDSDFKSALAYVYNKNKRDENGNVCTITTTTADDITTITLNVSNLHWYLPAIDEIEDIAMGAYDEFDKVFQNEEYWSCLPAYDKNRLSMDVMVGRWNPGDLYADYYSDDRDRARATSVYTTDGGKTYQFINSGVPGYAGTQYGTVDWSTPTFEEYTPNTLDFTDYKGNLPRSQKCRIRAVYRSGVGVKNGSAN